MDLTNKFFNYTPDFTPEGNCFVIGMPEDVYFRQPGLSYTSSKEFMKSPAHYQAYLKKEHELDPDREFFKAVHLLTLEEPDAANRIVVKDGRWAGKLKDEVVELKARGYIVVKQEAFDRANQVAASIKANKLAALPLKEGYGEISMFWTDPHSGVRCKGRIDCLEIAGDEVRIYDLKNFSGLHDEELMGKQVINQRYHYQMAFYSLGVMAILQPQSITTKWIFCEDDVPYGVKVRKCPVFLLDNAYLHYQEILFPYFKHCLDNNEWPCFEEEEEQELFVPAYLMKGKNNES